MKEKKEEKAKSYKKGWNYYYIKNVHDEIKYRDITIVPHLKLFSFKLL